jgi:hypothetical protein
MFIKMVKNRLLILKRLENLIIAYLIGIVLILSLNVFLFRPTLDSLSSILVLVLLYVVMIATLMSLYLLKKIPLSSDDDEESLKKIKQDVNDELDEDKIRSEINEKSG